jgi:hypothetical protein
MIKLSNSRFISHLPRVGRSLFLACISACAVTALADTPDPIPAATKVALRINSDNSITATLSGKWQWTTRKNDCNLDRFGVGWAVDWNDASQAGNYLGTVGNLPVNVGVQVGNSRNPADNEVNFNPGPNPARCGVYARNGATSFNTGDWGPISHTYKDHIDLSKASVCVVLYDLHSGKGGKRKGKNGALNTQVKDGDLEAGGNGHNKDNSVTDNAGTPLGNQCIRVKLSDYILS